MENLDETLKNELIDVSDVDESDDDELDEDDLDEDEYEEDIEASDEQLSDDQIKNIYSSDGDIDLYLQKIFFQEIIKPFKHKKDETDNDIKRQKDTARKTLRFAFEKILGWSMYDTIDHLTSGVIVKLKLVKTVSLLTGINCKSDGYTNRDLRDICIAVYPKLRKKISYDRTFDSVEERFTVVGPNNRWKKVEIEEMRNREDTKWACYFEVFLNQCFNIISTGDLYRTFANTKAIKAKIDEHLLKPVFEADNRPLDTLHTYLSMLSDDNIIKADNVLYSLYSYKAISES